MVLMHPWIKYLQISMIPWHLVRILASFCHPPTSRCKPIPPLHLSHWNSFLQHPSEAALLEVLRRIFQLIQAIVLMRGQPSGSPPQVEPPVQGRKRGRSQGLFLDVPGMFSVLIFWKACRTIGPSRHSITPKPAFVSLKDRGLME